MERKTRALKISSWNEKAVEDNKQALANGEMVKKIKTIKTHKDRNKFDI